MHALLCSTAVPGTVAPGRGAQRRRARRQQPCSASGRQTEEVHCEAAACPPPPRVASRRGLLASSLAGALALACPAAAATIDLSKAPTKQPWDYQSDERLVDAQRLFQSALNAEDVREEERLWTAIIDKLSGARDAPWRDDTLARVFGNRGNARGRQGKLQEALSDYEKAQELAPYAVDPVLNHGVVLEQLGRFEESIADYKEVLRASPDDPAAHNNLGNSLMGLRRYPEAVASYSRAVELAPQFSFAQCNRAIALFADGRRSEAERAWRALLRRYPDFTDARAALAAALWVEGLQGQAETEWQRVDDPRYRDRAWLRKDRRWPPELVDAMVQFLDIKD